MPIDPSVSTSHVGDTSPPLRLAIVSHRFQKNDGQGRVNYEVARAALDHGVKLTLVTEHCAEDLATHPNIRVVHAGLASAPTQLGRNLAFAFRSARWLRAHRHEFDLVQANGFVTWEPCDIVAAHFVHSSWINSPHYPFKRSIKPYDIYQLSYTWLNSRWERHAFGSARRVIAVSELVADDVAALGVPRDRIGVIYNGVDTDEFHPGPSERASFGLPEEVPIAVFVGDIRTSRKNLSTLLRATAHVESLHIAVAGTVEGSSAPSLARSLGIADRVHFLGKTPRVAALMRSVDLFCFPSLYEPFGLVVLEAVASNLPVVTSQYVGAARGLGEGCVILENPIDEDELAGVLRSLLGDPRRFQKMRQTLSEQDGDLGWSGTTQAYLRTYSQLRTSSV